MQKSSGLATLKKKSLRFASGRCTSETTEVGDADRQRVRTGTISAGGLVRLGGIQYRMNGIDRVDPLESIGKAAFLCTKAGYITQLVSHLRVLESKARNVKIGFRIAPR